VKYRLGPNQRLRKRHLFRLIYNKGNFVKGSCLSLWSYERSELGTNQKGPVLGVVVSRKTSAKAVERNRWKRRIREAFRLNQSLIKPSLIILVQSRRRDPIPSYKTIESEMKELLEKTKSLR
jgi:ribonuclease P protein component